VWGSANNNQETSKKIWELKFLLLDNSSSGLIRVFLLLLA